MRERWMKMVSQVYAPKSGQVSPWATSRDRFYHIDCGSGSAPLMGLDIGGNVGDDVYFRVYNDGSFPLHYRYRRDCTGYPSFEGWQQSSALVVVRTTAGAFGFRFTHIVIDSDITNEWSTDIAVQTGNTASFRIGELCAVTVKEGVPGYANDECGQTPGSTDIGGLCSEAPHLHFASDNGNAKNCYCDGPYDEPESATPPSSGQWHVGTSTPLFWK